MKTGLSILILSLLLIQMLAQRVSTTQRTAPINTRVGSYGGIQTKLGGTTSTSSRPTSTRTTSTTGTSSTSRTSATSRIIGASGAVSGAQKPTQRGSIVSTEPIRVGESIITNAQERVEPGRLMTSTNGDRFSSTSSLLESDPHRRHVNSTNERFGNIIEEFKVIERKESTPVIEWTESTPVIGDYKKINFPRKTTMNSKYTDNSDNVFGEIDYDVLAAELYPDNEDFNPSIKEKISYSSSTNSTSPKGTEESQETSEYSKPKEDVSPPKPSPEQIKKAREKAIAEYKQELEKAKLEAVREYQTELARKQAIEEFKKQLAQQEIKKGKQELVEICNKQTE
ncbi:unnamed protein product [Moneuplotes crassus]|uniref:Uncharacterized protein n=1 Tax=Euplotes crassus TaxID=5936 RepID=A0AAD2D9H9_EUPCR|nr:unnamed protein product [Moneuplotes crassus]